jgi:hypothetical protein
MRPNCSASFNASIARTNLKGGGRIWSDAADDRGATFNFTLKETTHL